MTFWYTVFEMFQWFPSLSCHLHKVCNHLLISCYAAQRLPKVNGGQTPADVQNLKESWLANCCYCTIYHVEKCNKKIIVSTTSRAKRVTALSLKLTWKLEIYQWKKVRSAVDYWRWEVLPIWGNHYSLRWTNMCNMAEIQWTRDDLWPSLGTFQERTGKSKN